MRSLLVGGSRGSPTKQLIDDGLNQKNRSLFSKMHLIARGNITGGIADARQTAVGVAHRVPHGNVFRAQGYELLTQARAGPIGFRTSGSLRNQTMMQHEIAHHLVWQPALLPRHRTLHNYASVGLFFQRGHRLGYAIEIPVPGTMQEHDLGPDLSSDRQDLVVDRAAVGYACHIGVERREARTGRKLRDTEGATLLRLAQTRQQRAGGRTSPDQYRGPGISTNRTSGKPRFMADSEPGF